MDEEFQLEDDELIVADESFQASKNSYPFRMVLTSHAVYLTRLNKRSLSEPWYLERILHSNIREVLLAPVRPLAAWAAAVVFLGLGITTLILMYLPSSDGSISGWPFALVVGGLVIPFAVRGRKQLVVRLIDETYIWKPEIVIDGTTRAEIRRVQESLLETFRALRIRVLD